ncbi:hypothetical protein ACIQCF_35650 [Streptomyces sp. NPDC088353]|uniref:hypothetical protein n=1 Tax=Streptomyces sp. NPDC088353 TaxID=3365855 RepID=UPI0038242471
MSDPTQKIYDHTRHGQLLSHPHADDGHTAGAVGTYLDSGKSVYLYGENHQRQIADTYDSPAKALTDFERVHSETMRPGPAPMADTEREAARTGTSLTELPAQPEPPTPQQEVVPSYTADPGDHDAILDHFLDTQPLGEVAHLVRRHHPRDLRIPDPARRASPRS